MHRGIEISRGCEPPAYACQQAHVSMHGVSNSGRMSACSGCMSAAAASCQHAWPTCRDVRSVHMHGMCGVVACMHACAWWCIGGARWCRCRCMHIVCMMMGVAVAAGVACMHACRWWCRMMTTCAGRDMSHPASVYTESDIQLRLVRGQLAQCMHAYKHMSLTRASHSHMHA